MDQEAEESSQNEFVPACEDRRELRTLEPFGDIELKEIPETKVVPESIDEDDEPMPVQANVLNELNKIETLTEAIMSSDERANQRKAAMEIFEEIRSRVLNELGEPPQPPLEVIIEEMEQIEEPSDQEDDITEEAVVEEDVPVAVDEENNIVQQQNVPPSWCSGGYDEDTMEMTSCGYTSCASCNWQN